MQFSMPKKNKMRPAEKDVVCGMSIDPDRAEHHHIHNGVAYHFCGAPLRRPVTLPRCP
jgi:hypothetical protein